MQKLVSRRQALPPLDRGDSAGLESRQPLQRVRIHEARTRQDEGMRAAAGFGPLDIYSAIS